MQAIRATRLAAAAALMLLAGTGAASAGTLDRMKQDKTFRLAYREDAPPFSFKNTVGEPAGFMVELCRAVAKDMAQQFGAPLTIVYVPVTAADRFAAITDGKADVLCEPTTETLTRRQTLDYSIPTFVDGASLMVRDNGPADFASLAGKKVGVLAGTTTEDELRGTLKKANVSAEVVLAKTHTEGVGMLDDGKITAYFADRTILEFLVSDSKAPERLQVATTFLTVEPYALALPHGDEDFRLAVDRALSRIYRSGDIVGIFNVGFLGRVKPTQTVRTLYLIAALPE